MSELLPVPPDPAAPTPKPGRRRDRLTAWIAVAVLVALGGAIAVLGTGAGPGGNRLADIGAWLANGDSSASHVNGLTGTVDARVELKSPEGHRLEITQADGIVLVTDLETGIVSRIDPASLTVGAGQDFGHTDITVIAGEDVAYVESPSTGLVQQVDPTTLSLVGKPVSLPAPLGRAAIDGNSTLWVPVPHQGTAMPIKAGVPGDAVPVGKPGDILVLTIAAGNPVITASGSDVVTVIKPDGSRSINLPPSSSDGSLLSPATTDGATVPVLAAKSGTLSLVDTGTGTTTAVPVPGNDALGSPQTVGHRVYLPDESAGTLVVFNLETHEFEEPVPVTGRPGSLAVLVKDGLLWVNDSSGTEAVVIGSDGRIRHVRKHDAPGGTGSAPAETPHPQATRPEAPPSDPPAPQAPATVTATSGAGFITVAFAPAAGATGYTLTGQASGASVAPGQIPGRGQPFQFVVTGGSCDRTYSFTVVARYPGGDRPSQPSVAVRPCVPPGQPGNLRAQAVDHGSDVSWTAPAQNGGAALGYKVSYSGGGKQGETGYLGGTSTRLTGLANFTRYQVQLEAANPSGASSRLTTSVNLVGPTWVGQVYQTSVGQPDVRSGPSVDDPIIGAAQGGGNVTVICQVWGGPAGYVKPTREHVTSNIWDKIQFNGGTGYISDLYLPTPNSNLHTFSNPPLWNCS